MEDLLGKERWDQFEDVYDYVRKPDRGREIMRIPRFKSCCFGNNHAWGWIDDVDNRGERDSKEWRARVKEVWIERDRDPKYFPHSGQVQIMMASTNVTAVAPKPKTTIGSTMRCTSSFRSISICSTTTLSSGRSGKSQRPHVVTRLRTLR
jgi:hypothetical protein